MQKTVLTLLITIAVVVCLHAFKAYQQPVISGRVFPKDAAAKVIVVNGTDSLTGRTDRDGKFSVNVKPGTWKLIIQGKQPYKDRIMEKVLAKEGGGSDIALIPLYR
jgi:hypothetical protein